MGGLAQQVAGVVRVSVSESMSGGLVYGWAGQFCTEHPQIELEWVVDNQPSNLLGREADVAVRMYKPEQLDLVARRLGEGLCAAFADHGIACHYNVLGPMVRLFLTAGPKTLDHCLGLDTRALNLFHLALITEGVLTIPGSNDFFLSFAHGDEEIYHVIAAAGRVLERFDFRAITEPLEGGRHVH